MTPKERRDRLFNGGKPLVRRLEILDGEAYSSDMGVCWAAYKAGSFNLPEGLSQEDFVKSLEEHFSQFAQVWIIDDRNKNFTKEKGQIGLVLTNNVDLVIDAKFGFFKWATKRNILRSSAAFLNMIKHSTKTGLCFVRAEKDKRVLPDHLKDYDLLYFVGKVSDNQYLYSIRGRGSQ